MVAYSNNPNVYEIVQACLKHGVKHIVISPGSRNAPLVLSFARNNKFQCYSIVDERVAAFFALGMSLQTQSTIALVCTSGTAVLNYAPAVAEAYYQNIPLLVLSADRPKELIDQAEGQAIRQAKILDNIVERSYTLSGDTAPHHIAYSKRLINEALSLCKQTNRPTHINIPLWEPLYTTTTYDDRDYHPLTTSQTIIQLQEHLLKELSKEFENAKKVLIVIGFMRENKVLNKQLEQFAKKYDAVVCTETISNLKSTIFHYNIDKLLTAIPNADTEYCPDLVITCGGTLVSKMMKQWLRNCKQATHWHINDKSYFVDTFQLLSRNITVKPEIFFEQLGTHLQTKKQRYSLLWEGLNQVATKIHSDFLQQTIWSDLQCFETLLENIPNNTNLHLGNSTVIRYHQLFPYNNKLQYTANRGTSGIDGCTSTAVGIAHETEAFTTIITGDISLKYDSNALWHNHINPKLRIIVINNGGGGIFRFLKDASEQAELENFFETSHSSGDSKTLAAHWGIDYLSVSSNTALKKVIQTFYTDNATPKMLEIFTPRLTNAKILRAYFKELKQNTSTK